VVELDGRARLLERRDAYIELLRRALARGVTLRGVMLYGLARDSMQPEAARLGKVDRSQLESFAEEIRALGLEVSVHD
jgi:hypothetical protein